MKPVSAYQRRIIYAVCGVLVLFFAAIGSSLPGPIGTIMDVLAIVAALVGLTIAFCLDQDGD